MQEVLFTGQPVVKIVNNDQYVSCTKCGKLTNVNSAAYFDKYQPTEDGPHGTYVHFGCLSTQRMMEITH